MKNFLKHKPAPNTVQVSEVFSSIEGEGPLTGYPMIFIRTFGCNFTCQGFSNPTLEPQEFKHIEVLTQFKPTTGCDSSYSWHPNFKHLATKYDIATLWEKIYQVLPGYAKDLMNEHHVTSNKSFPAISITGGEPLLHQKFWAEFFSAEASMRYIKKLVIETNGSVPIHPKFAKALKKLEKEGCLIVWANSPKLSGSGEPKERAIKPLIMLQQQTGLRLPVQYLKFVSDGSDESFEEIDATVNEYNEYLYEHQGEPFKPEQVYVMPEGALLEQQEAIQRKVAEACIENGYSLCARVHVWVFGNETGT